MVELEQLQESKLYLARLALQQHKVRKSSGYWWPGRVGHLWNRKILDGFKTFLSKAIASDHGKFHMRAVCREWGKLHCAGNDVWICKLVNCKSLTTINDNFLTSQVNTVGLYIPSLVIKTRRWSFKPIGNLHTFGMYLSLQSFFQ